MKTLHGHDKPEWLRIHKRAMTTNAMTCEVKVGRSHCWGRMITVVLLCSMMSVWSAAAAESIEDGLKKGLIEEEANRNFQAAIEQYEKVVRQVDAQRQIAATAIFRLGETYRKLGRTNDAVQAYRRVITEFGSEEMLTKLSRQNLTALGVTKLSPTSEGQEPVEEKEEISEATRSALRDLYNAELVLLTKQEGDYMKAIAAGVMRQEEPSLLNVRREILALKRKLVEVSDRNFKAGGVGVTAESVGDAEAQEIQRLKKILAMSPDLLNASEGEMKMTPLETAASRGQLLVVEFLLGQPGLDSNTRGNGNWSALHWATLNGHKSVVERLVKAGFPVDSLTKKGNQTPLHLAVARGHRLIVESLLKLGADAKAITGTFGADLTSPGVTPLGVAVAMNHKELIALLIEAGGYDPKLPGQLASPLKLAVDKKNAEIAELLFNHGAREDVHFHSSWLTSARQNTPELVRAFLKTGADPNATDGGSPGTSPLMQAVGNADSDSVKVLLEARANPNGAPRDKKAEGNGWITPLTSALSQPFWMNHVNQGRSPEKAAQVVELLLEAGADPNLQDGWEAWPLALMMSAPMESDMRKRLLEAFLKRGADPTKAIAASALSLLHMLAQENYPEFLEVALRYSKNVNPVDDEGRTPLALVSGLLKSTNLGSEYRSALEAKRVKFVDQGGKMDGLVLDAILVSRDSTASMRSIVRRDPAGWNRFTLHEVVAMAYGLCSRPNVPKMAVTNARLPGRSSMGPQIVVPQAQFNPTADPALSWPDLTNIVVRRLVSTNLAELKPGEERKVILTKFENMELEWGDIVEIPEADHPLNSGWMDNSLRNILASTMPRSIRVSSGGKETEVKLGWGKSIPASYSVGRVLDDSGLLLKSSNLSAVKIVRGKGKVESDVVPYLVLDLNESTLKYNLWVRDGDRIEIP